ncbi:MAG TPA: plasmid pRiA4b ORF-3 family protein [Sporosarcina sp.]|nr:plasmid pRiA4b ORF-3 family protein [Sporosarcina sp.]
MQIQATKKLLDRLPVEVVEVTEGNPLYDWHANLVTIHRRQVVVLMNDLTRYVIVLYGVKAKDFNRFDEVVKEAIRHVFQKERFSSTVIDNYIDALGTVTFHKTKNRTMTSWLKKAVEHVQILEDEITTKTLINDAVSMIASRFLVGGANGSLVPYEALVEALGNITKASLFQSDVAVLHISLELENHVIWRKLVVPLDLSFKDFHNVLQAAFNWNNTHLHEYYFFNVKDEERAMQRTFVKPIQNIVMDERFLSDGMNGVEMLLEEGLSLADYIPNHRYMQYIYDFGDHWVHSIVVEEVLYGQNIGAPKCIDWKGIAPPEDCGGEPGFDTFVSIVNDKTHPENKEITSWGEIQGYQRFNLDLVNQQLSEF